MVSVPRTLLCDDVDVEEQHPRFFVRPGSGGSNTGSLPCSSSEGDDDEVGEVGGM